MWLFGFFVWRPERAALVAVLFGAAAFPWCRAAVAKLADFVAQWMSRRFRGWPCIVAAVAWAVYAIYEAYAKAKGWNIRVDLLLIDPMLGIVSAAALVLSYRWRIASGA
jgi:hypothetical protein